jgi:O-acetylserine/cysteine efflux transporter
MAARANVLARKVGDVGAVSLTVWSSLASPLPLLLLSVAFDGPSTIVRSVTSLSWLSVAALAYLIVLSTLVGYSAWNHLIVRHGAGRVAPFSMLVPIFGLASGAIFLGERFTPLHAAAGALVLSGVGLHAFWPASVRRPDARAARS